MPPPDESILHDVVQLAKQGMTWRAIARALHISRNTVRQIMRGHAEARTREHCALVRPRTAPSRPSKLDPFRREVDALFRQYPDITAQRVYEILRDKGFDGGETIVKDLVRRIRPKPAPKPSLETPPREPGDMAECDWSPYPVTFTHAPPMTLQAFGYTLRYSTRKFYSFHEGNGLHPLMDGHVHAFERFGAAARRCKYDNQKPVVLRWEGAQPIYTGALSKTGPLALSRSSPHLEHDFERRRIGNDPSGSCIWFRWFVWMDPSPWPSAKLPPPLRSTATSTATTYRGVLPS
jgi:transposase